MHLTFNLACIALMPLGNDMSALTGASLDHWKRHYNNSCFGDFYKHLLIGILYFTGYYANTSALKNELNLNISK